MDGIRGKLNRARLGRSETQEESTDPKVHPQKRMQDLAKTEKAHSLEYLTDDTPALDAKVVLGSESDYDDDLWNGLHLQALEGYEVPPVETRRRYSLDLDGEEKIENPEGVQGFPSGKARFGTPIVEKAQYPRNTGLFEIPHFRQGGVDLRGSLRRKIENSLSELYGLIPGDSYRDKDDPITRRKSPAHLHTNKDVDPLPSPPADPLDLPLRAVKQPEVRSPSPKPQGQWRDQALMALLNKHWRSHENRHDQDPGYASEKITKFRALCLLLNIFRLRAFTKTHGGFKFTGGENSPGNRSRNSAPGKQPRIQKGSAQKSKRKDSDSSDSNHDGDSRDDDDSGNGRRPKKLKTTGDLRSLNGQLACPFAKAHPGRHLNCLLIGRKDLSGVKEHLKRNHFGRRLPDDIREAKTWGQVFDICNPEWKGPRPSQYFDALEISLNFATWSYPAIEHQRATFQSLDGYIDETLEGIGPLSNYKPSLMLIDRDEGLEMRYCSDPDSSCDDWTPGPSQRSGHRPTISAPRSPIPAPPAYFTAPQPLDLPSQTLHPREQPPSNSGDFTTEIPGNLDDIVHELAGPHLPWPFPREMAEAFFEFEQDYGLDTRVPTRNMYPDLVSAMKESTGWLGDESLLADPVLPQFPADTSDWDLLEVGQRRFTDPLQQTDGSSGFFPAMIGSTSSGSNTFATPPSPTTHLQYIETQSSDTDEGYITNMDATKSTKKYLLMVSRQPENAQSTEQRGHRLFYFDDFSEFRMHFEYWMKTQFTDPQFCWTKMELLNDLRKARLRNIDEVSVTEKPLFGWPGLRTETGGFEPQARNRGSARLRANGFRGIRDPKNTASVRSRPCADTTPGMATPIPQASRLEDDSSQRSHTTNIELTADDGHIAPQSSMDLNTEIEETAPAPSKITLLSLPSEIINNILFYLPEMSLYAVSLTCHALQSHSLTDSLWQNILGWPDLTSPYPYPSYRALHHALSPHLFLRRKIFIGDNQFFGSVLATRYMPVSGSIEAFRVITTPAIHHDVNWWSWDPTIPIYPYDTRVGLWREADLKITPNFHESGLRRIQPVCRGKGVFSSYVRAQAILKKDVYHQMAVWPPQTIPAETRVRNESATGFRSSAGSSMTLAWSVNIDGEEIPVNEGERAFGRPGGPVMQWSPYIPTPTASKDPDARWKVDEARSKSGFLSTSAFRIKKWAVLSVNAEMDDPRIGEDVETFAEVDEALWTPTKEYPYRGIWVGNYTPHAHELLLFHQPETTGGEKRLEVIKLTGDPNVPRGEYTWIIDDLSQPLRTADESEHEWPGAKVYKARGHIADHGFSMDRYVDIQVILPDPQRDWQKEVGQRNTNPGSAGVAPTQGETSDVARKSNDSAGDGWGVGREERGSASAGSSRKKKRIRYLDEPWVPRRAAVHWSALQGVLNTLSLSSLEVCQLHALFFNVGLHIDDSSISLTINKKPNALIDALAAMIAPMNTVQARKAALARFLQVAAGLASSFETGKQAASTLKEWLDQDELLDELVNSLPSGNDVSGHSDDPVVTVLDIVRSIIPAFQEHTSDSTPSRAASPESLADDEPAVETVQASASQASSTRWADYDDEEDYIPDILQPTAMEPAAVMAPGGPAGDDPAVVTARSSALPADGPHTSLELAAEKVPELAAVIAHRDPADYEPAAEMALGSAPWGSGRQTPTHEERDMDDEENDDDDDQGMGEEEVEDCEPSSFPPYEYPHASEIQDASFTGYWLDDSDDRHCYLGENDYLVNDYGECVKEGYFWDRHPFTAPMSAYEQLTLAHNSVSIGTPGELLSRRTVPGNGLTTRRDEFPGLKGIGERMRAKFAAAAANGPQQTSTCRPETVVPVDMPCATTAVIEEDKEAESTEKTKEGKPCDEVEVGVVEMTAPPPDASGSSDSHDTSSASLTDTTPPTTATPTLPTPMSTPAPMTPLEFLISRGLHLDRLGPGPPPRKKGRIWERRHSWVAKWQGEVQSLRTAYHDVGNKLVDKLTIRSGAW
ncbi:hypothetical protein Dda_8653 [Drechslerella dactyloides]|uniref:F-box domain-containing protein n=1 Tax=Drechslerella dactyloides TaxID=74499 RepID=A0AAD6IU15_DREDA|nr:hypothetical protein Dda_8653 [Drechslerella dactyloides]